MLQRSTREDPRRADRQPISAARLDQALTHAYENIVSSGTAHLVPEMRPRGLGAIAYPAADERFFVFKGRGRRGWECTSWPGRGDVVQAVFHMSIPWPGTSRRWKSSAEPCGQVEWIKQVVAREYGRKPPACRPWRSRSRARRKRGAAAEA